MFKMLNCQARVLVLVQSKNYLKTQKKDQSLRYKATDDDAVLSQMTRHMSNDDVKFLIMWPDLDVLMRLT